MLLTMGILELGTTINAADCCRWLGQAEMNCLSAGILSMANAGANTNGSQVSLLARILVMFLQTLEHHD